MSLDFPSVIRVATERTLLVQVTFDKRYSVLELDGTATRLRSITASLAEVTARTFLRFLIGLSEMVIRLCLTSCPPTRTFGGGAFSSATSAVAFAFASSTSELPTASEVCHVDVKLFC